MALPQNPNDPEFQRRFMEAFRVYEARSPTAFLETSFRFMGQKMQDPRRNPVFYLTKEARRVAQLKKRCGVKE